MYRTGPRPLTNGRPNAAGHASFEANGTAYRLRLDHNALADFEEITGQTVLDVFSPDKEGRARVGFAVIRALFYAGTLPRLHSKEAAGDLIAALGTEEAVEIVARAVQAAFPRAQEAQEDAQVPLAEEADGTGMD